MRTLKPKGQAVAAVSATAETQVCYTEATLSQARVPLLPTPSIGPMVLDFVPSLSLERCIKIWSVYNRYTVAD